MVLPPVFKVYPRFEFQSEIFCVVEADMLSILSIAHNHRDITEFLLTTLARPECADIPYELVFIDNGSTDDTLSLVKNFPLSANPNFRGLTYHRFSKNQGVATGINQAVNMLRV